MGRQLVITAACGLLLCACGARTGQLPPWLGDGGGGAIDAPAADGRWADGRIWLDINPHDACLPIPASSVQGSYSGTWTGSWSCPGMGPQSINGKLSFSLTPSGGPQSFKVKGLMSGMVAGTGQPFSSDVTGHMGCTALSASLPNITVGSGGLVISLSGAMQGAFTAPPGGKPGFPNGTWSAKETGPSPCQAAGTWRATQ